MSAHQRRLPSHIRGRARRLFGELRKAAEDQELSRLEVCRRSGVSPATVARVLDGQAHDLQLDTYLALAGALGRFRFDDRVSRMSPSELTAVRRVEWCQRLSAARERAGLSQGELADKLGVTQAQISLWERGVTTPRLCSYLLVAEAVGLRV